MKLGHIVVSQGKVGRMYTFFPRTVKKSSLQIEGLLLGSLQYKQKKLHRKSNKKNMYLMRNLK